MNIVIFGATGMVGKHLVRKALVKGHNVKAFGRNVDHLVDEDNANDKLLAIKGYVFDEESVYDALVGSDAVLSVLGGSFDGLDHTRSLGLKNIAKQMEKAGVERLVALGGAGVLTDENGVLLMEKPGYPKVYLPVGKEHLQAYLNIKDSVLNWTFVCAPDIKDEDGNGNYHTNAEHVPSPNNGHISAGDLADFILTSAEENSFNKQRVGISN
ncbi:NAD(P)-dependent oxidoreductase [Segetibacter sp. 3557_3]|uniref:NAD(P)-dependent oxidoreductase n=1 Tax=Segetibacter sp. 3557_3 TaxID=2547429 RepID=UPI0014052B7E|nr:NAD(P)H-binding protein [Segetibacter sp. 3557_3]